ncbi:hypothetical protein Poly51_32330 [Rubripirellula tenax]|uniref:Uncharacterized protein n=1 Tax=Rubripirellula tenax TaxID=2528015 RepID=A0A5C6F1P7_9BACT|nr:hypothetical protein Poly51_32330 [Rubripirellula tenax]
MQLRRGSFRLHSSLKADADWMESLALIFDRHPLAPANPLELAPGLNAFVITVQKIFKQRRPATSMSKRFDIKSRHLQIAVLDA